jgi:hypothetical protein
MKFVLEEQGFVNQALRNADLEHGLVHRALRGDCRAISSGSSRIAGRAGR